MENQKVETKCCAECKHCIIRYQGAHIIHYCRKTEKRDKVSGDYAYTDCHFVIDTKMCQFEQRNTHLVEGISVAVVSVILAWIFFFKFL